MGNEPLSSSCSRDDSEVDFGLTKLFDSSPRRTKGKPDQLGLRRRGEERESEEKTEGGRDGSEDSRQLLEKRG